MKIITTAKGFIDKSGVFRIYNQDEMKETLSQYKNKPVTVLITEYQESATQRQIAYYKAVVVPLFVEGFRQLGDMMTEVECDWWIREHFCVKLNGQGGKTMELNELSKSHLKDLIEFCKYFAAEHFETSLPAAH